MAARGRPPKPIERQRVNARDATHKADGRELAVPQHQMSRSVLVPVCPDELGERGETEWEKIWTAGYWLSDEQDYHWVSMICTAYDEISDYRAIVQVEGMTVDGIHGTKIAHPLIAEIRRAQNQIMKCLSMLGFSPTDRSRLALGEVKRENLLVDLHGKMNAK